MNRKECRMARREIEQSELNQRMSGQALAHVKSCLPCREFNDERARLRELVGSLDPVTAPGDFDLRLRARIAAERQRSARGSFFTRFAVSTPAIAVAALVVMLVASIVWFAQRGGNPGSPTASVPPGAVEKIAADKSIATNDSSSPVEAGTNPQSATLTAQESRGRGRNVLSRGAVARATDFSVRGAESIRQREVSLSAPVKPLVVSLEDDRGGKRKISLPPVSFGSQRLVDNRVPAGTPNSRSW